MGRDFEEFYRSTFPSMVVLAVAVTAQRAGAEDIVQDAMVDAHRRWDRLAVYDSPRAWVRRVVVQRSMKTLRKRSNELDAVRRSARAEVEPPQPGFDPLLRQALMALPDQQRAVIALHYLEDMSVADAARVLGVSDGTVKTQLVRGRSRLSTLFGSEGAELHG